MDPHHQASAERPRGAELVVVGARSGPLPEEDLEELWDEPSVTPPPAGRATALVDRAITLARSYAAVAGRVALGVVFVWFGLLKVLHASPASDLIRELLAATVPAVPAEPAVMVLGVVEIVIGIGFLTWIAPRTTLLLFLPQMAMATGGTLLFLPAVMFAHGNPLLLSMSGEFVVKNLVLVAAGLMVLAGVPTRAEREGR
jgi:hypothetical protein